MSLVVAEVFLCSSIFPAWADPSTMLRARPAASAKDGALRDIQKDLEPTAARDGALKEDKSVLDLSEVISREIAAYQPYAETRKVHIQFIDSSDKISFEDVQQGVWLRSVFGYHLLMNAIKYSKPEGGTVTVTLKKEGHEIIIEIKDEGIGISPEDLLTIAENKTAQFRAVNARESGESGNGIGLIAARTLLEHVYHGSLNVESEGIGKGTIVTMRFPATAARDGGKQTDQKEAVRRTANIITLITIGASMAATEGKALDGLMGHVKEIEDLYFDKSSYVSVIMDDLRTRTNGAPRPSSDIEHHFWVTVNGYVRHRLVNDGVEPTGDIVMGWLKDPEGLRNYLKNLGPPTVRDGGAKAALVEKTDKVASYLHPNDIAAGLTPDSTIGDRAKLIRRWYNDTGNEVRTAPFLPVAGGAVSLPVTRENVHPIVFDAVKVLNTIQGIQTHASGPDEISGDIRGDLEIARKGQMLSAMRGLPMHLQSDRPGQFRVFLNFEVKLRDAKRYWDIFAKRLVKLSEDGRMRHLAMPKAERQNFRGATVEMAPLFSP